MTLDELNRLDDAAAREAFGRCCGASQWAARMAARRPYSSIDTLLETADMEWGGLAPHDWEEAFAHHPRLGEQAVRRRFEGTRVWSADEQAGAFGAAAATRQALAEGNHRYEKRFGRVFLLCATGKSAADMLEALEARLGNDPEQELYLAAEEQRKITRLRLRKLLTE